jgi:hypothetical protein
VYDGMLRGSKQIRLLGTFADVLSGERTGKMTLSKTVSRPVLAKPFYVLVAHIPVWLTQTGRELRWSNS